MFFPRRESYQLHREADTEPKTGSSSQEFDAPWSNPFSISALFRRKKRVPSTPPARSLSQAQSDTNYSCAIKSQPAETVAHCRKKC